MTRSSISSEPFLPGIPAVLNDEEGRSEVPEWRQQKQLLFPEPSVHSGGTSIAQVLCMCPGKVRQRLIVSEKHW